MMTAGPTVGTDVSLAVYDTGRVSVEQLRLAERAAGEIDVAISAAAICGSDLHTVLGHRSAPERTALGHEGVGRITDVDDGTTDLRGTGLSRGDRVVFALFSSCGTCDRCVDGLPMKCRSLLKYGHESVLTPPYATGTLASAVRLLPGVPVLRIPDDVDDAVMVSAGCAVATAAAVVATAGSPGSGTSLLIFGAGAVGAYCAAMLSSLGCAVTVRDPVEERLAIVERFGGTADRSGEGTYPIVVEASGNAQAFMDAVQAADIGGRVVAAGSVSLGSSTASIDPAWLVTRRITVSGVHNYTAADFRYGVDWLLAEGRHLGLQQLLSAPLPLSAIDDAFAMMRAGRHPRVLIRPDSPGHGRA